MSQVPTIVVPEPSATEPVPSPTSRRYRFDDFVLDVETGELERDGVPVQLTPQAVRVMSLLVTRAGELTSRDDIRRELWDDEAHVEADLGINHVIRRVRQALGDSASDPRYVETIPRRGYRFKVPVEPLEDRPSRPSGMIETPDVSPLRRASAARLGVVVIAILAAVAVLWQATRTGSTPTGSESEPARLAVLPLGAADDLRSLADGLGEEITAALIRNLGGELDVLAFSSARGPGAAPRAQLAEDGVDYAVSGTIGRRGDDLQAKFELHDLAGERLLWHDTYDVSRARLPELQADLTLHLAEALAVEPPADHDATADTLTPQLYERYLQALGLLQRVPTNDAETLEQRDEMIRRARALLDGILLEAPQSAAAWAALARAHSWSQLWLPPREYAPVTVAAARRAVTLDPTLGEAWAMLASLTLDPGYDWATADRYSRQAVRLSPGVASVHSIRGIVLAVAGRVAEAKEEMVIARRLDPLSWQIAFRELYVDYLARDWDTAVRRSEALREAHPDDPVLLSIILRIYQSAGRSDEAREAIRERREALGLAEIPEDDLIPRFWQDSLDYAQSSDRLLRSAAYWRAIPLIGLDRGEEAAELFREEACTDGVGTNLVLIHIEPFLRRLEGIPAYEEAVRCVGMPPPPPPP